MYETINIPWVGIFGRTGILYTTIDLVGFIEKNYYVRNANR
jgi:hypothetical protein